MKIAIPADGPDFDAKVGDKLGLSPYLLVVDLESRQFEVIGTPRGSATGAGMQVVAQIIAKKSNVVLTGWCSPIAGKYLSTHGVEIVAGMSGTVAESLNKFEKRLKSQTGKSVDSDGMAGKIDRRIVAHAIRGASHQFKSLAPSLIGVIFLTGLFSAFISEDFLTSIFSGKMWLDSFWGAVMGSLFAGNPVNSYIIGAQMLEKGVSLIGVTSFICSWVTVGLIQFPAESTALGWSFAVVRNLSCFGLSMAISFTMLLILKFFGM